MARPWLIGAPPTIAGTARTGSARAVAIWSPVDAVSAAAATPPSIPALRSITTLNRARDDPSQRISRELPTCDREPALGSQRDPVEFPQTDRARHLEQEHEDRESPVEMPQRGPRRQDREQARKERIERNAGDGKED